MSQNISIGIDIGTSTTRVVVLQDISDTENKPPKIFAIAEAPSKGLRHGYVTNVTETAKGIRTALKSIEKSLIGIKPPKICISVGGVGLGGNIFQSTIHLSKSELEVTDADVAKVSESGRSDMPQAFSLNRKVIHSFPLQYKVDGRVVPGRPHGLKGSRLESRTLFITSLNHHINDILEAVEDAGFEVEDIVSSPIARGNFLLTKAEKIAGVALLDIGFETVSLVVYENGLPISLETFSIGSNDITNDIALGLKVSLAEAEEIKKGSVARAEYPKKKLDDIVNARLSDIFELVEAHLKKIGKNGLLPAGIVLCGGGSEILHIEAVAKTDLKLPARRVEERIDNGTRGQIKISEWAAAYGAALFSLSNEDEESFGLKQSIALGKRAGKGMWEWIKQFLP